MFLNVFFHAWKSFCIHNYSTGTSESLAKQTLYQQLNYNTNQACKQLIWMTSSIDVFPKDFLFPYTLNCESCDFNWITHNALVLPHANTGEADMCDRAIPIQALSNSYIVCKWPISTLSSIFFSYDSIGSVSLGFYSSILDVSAALILYDSWIMWRLIWQLEMQAMCWWQAPWEGFSQTPDISSGN